ncbi:MAG: HlyC/CorC family transporter [Thermomicrobiales bacterium]|nr:HlyC/CorC family transporter [Thermomicrobiales bacterium]
MLFEIGLVLLLIVANGVFSGSETAVVSARQARLQQRADAGDEGARRALQLSEHPNIFLATVQIGITLIGILSGAFGGARLSKPVADLLEGVPGVERYADTIAFALVVLIITYLSLVVGELVPKRIALNNPEGIASAVAGPMSKVASSVAPVAHLLGKSTDALLSLLRIRQSTDSPITEEEVGVLLEQGARAGVFLPAERDMAERIFALADDRVAALMTPRPDVVWLDLESTEEEMLATVIESPFSRFPVGQGSIDNVIGVVRAKELLSASSPRNLRDLTRDPMLLPETMPALQALERFRRAGEHFGVIIDEYGGTAGVLSLQDILEAIVGDLPGEGEPAVRGALRRDDGSWLLDGSLSADDVEEHLDLRSLPGQAEGLFETLGGFVLTRIGHIPAAGERFTWEGWTFEVMDMDGHRVDKVLATPLPGSDEDDRP